MHLNIYDQKRTVPALDDADKGSADDRLAWNKLMYEFSAGILIHMAASVAEKFNWQSAELFGTRIPLGLF